MAMMKPGFDSDWYRWVVWPVLVVLVVAVPARAEVSEPVCGVVDIDGIGWQRLRSITGAAGVDWWVEFGPQLLLCGDASVFDRVGPATMVAGPLDASDVWIVRGFDAVELAQMDHRVVAGEPRFGVVLGSSGSGIDGMAGDDSHDRRIVRARKNTIVVRQGANRPPRTGEAFGPEIQAIVDEVDGDRWFADVVTLASYNRYTYGPDILQARDWLVQQFGGLPGLEVETPSFPVGGTTAYNVIATMVGTGFPDDWYIVGGHYDATSEDPDTAAPGAEDNASGCAGVLEMARILTDHPPQATVLFICYSGEEQGLVGSFDHVADLLASDQLWKVQAMLNMDMIGYTGDPDLDCLLETEEFAQTLLNLFSDAADQFTELRIETSLFAWGSDHVPYLGEGVPALLTIENDWSFYPYYHTTGDLPEHLTVAMGEEILKMNVAAMAEMAGASADLDFRDGFELGDTAAWSATIP